MFMANTPWFHNLYEFNTGDDSERRSIEADFFPYSLLFAAVLGIGNRALAWNILGLFSLWASYLFCWLLVRRFTRDDFTSALAALLVLILPYRWATLLGGSPTGISMLLPPLLFLGLDMAVRDRRWLGGALAGASMLIASQNDAHIFFLGMLCAPCWCIVCWMFEGARIIRPIREWLRIAGCLLPFALIAGFPALLVQLSLRGGATDGTTIEKGRGLQEVALFSPHASGIFGWMTTGHDTSIYLGHLLPALLLLGLVSLIWRFFRTPSRPSAAAIAAYAMLLSGCLIMVLLALGVNGPQDGRVLHFTRAHIPHFDMIRQPAKIYSILPALLAVCAGLGMKSVLSIIPQKAARPAYAGLALFILLMTFTFAWQVRPTVCLLDDTQEAYAAVAGDAQTRGVDPRAIVLPIWPGDSAWTSLYQHYVSLYRIRMINGYLPVISTEYQQLALSYEMANVGVFTPENWLDLKSRGIEYILFHEDAFPEQVSNFPAGYTLFSLLRSPNLALLKQDGSVWAFKILEKPAKPARIPALYSWTTFFPSGTCIWDAERGNYDEAAITLDSPDAFGGRSVVLSPGQALQLYRFPHAGAPEAALLARVRGNGTLQTSFLLDELGKANTNTQKINSSDWTWKRFPLGSVTGYATVQPTFQCLEGTVDLDAVISFAGDIPSLDVGQTWSLPAPLFFRGGYTDLAQNAVVLRPDYESDGGRWGIFYGPRLPLPTGTYRVNMHLKTKAPAGTELGSFYIRCGEHESKDFPVFSGNQTEAVFTNNPAQLTTFIFTYSRKAPISIRSVDFTRIR